jgi:cation transporter-like permease
MKRIIKELLLYIAAYWMASVIAYGIYWIGGGEGRSIVLAFIMVTCWTLTTALLRAPR